MPCVIFEIELVRQTFFPDVGSCLWVAKSSALRIFLLGTRYSPKSIQQAPMSDPNPSRNPMKNQTLAPWFPKQPVV